MLNTTQANHYRWWGRKEEEGVAGLIRLRSLSPLSSHVSVVGEKGKKRFVPDLLDDAVVSDRGKKRKVLKSSSNFRVALPITLHSFFPL